MSTRGSASSDRRRTGPALGKRRAPGVNGSHRSNGFTLVELLIGATLSGAVMAAVLSSYIFLGRSFTRLTNQQVLESEARRTLATFAKDVQAASGLSGTPTASTVALFVPTGTGTHTITYYYNSTASDATVTVNGASISMAAQALTRCDYDGTAVTSLVLLRHITDNDAATTTDLFFRYYDGSTNNNPYDNGAAPFTTIATYASGIKQLSLHFSTQTGINANGTQTQVYRVASSRLQLRNSALLQ